MIIAGKMQDAVDHQVAEMVGQGLALIVGLGATRFKPQDNIAKRQGRAGRRRRRPPYRGRTVRSHSQDSKLKQGILKNDFHNNF